MAESYDKGHQKTSLRICQNCKEGHESRKFKVEVSTQIIISTTKKKDVWSLVQTSSNMANITKKCIGITQNR